MQFNKTRGTEMNKEDKKELERFKKNKKIIIKVFSRIVNKQKFSEKEIKKIGKVRTELKFGELIKK